MARLSASVVINNQTYNLTYNEQTGYFEGTIEAPSTGGIYEATITYYDVIERAITTTRDVQVLEKEPIKVDQNKNFMWIFNSQTFEVVDIVEIASYEIIIDEETNENSTIKVLKETTARANDIVVVKRNNEAIYYGIISEIQNEDGKNSYVYVCKYITNLFDRKVKLEDESWISTNGIEAFIEHTIERNFEWAFDDELLALSYLNTGTNTITKLTTSVSGVENGLYNLHTFMTNCTQKYNVNYIFNVAFLYNASWKLTMLITTRQNPKELIDVNAMNITNYQEVFETDVVAKVIVYSTNNQSYTLYLKTDRTTTTNPDDPDRAFGKVEATYVENFDEAPQEALNVLKGNRYNHNISFSLDRYIPIGTPIAIKTKNSIVYDTYISSIKMTSSKFYDYQCGNIRINFIEKLLKERNN